MSTNQKWNYELIAAMAAVFIGACALITSVIQTQVMLKQQAASVLPIVQWTISANINTMDSTGSFALSAFNKGVGPAIIEQVRIVYQGKQLPEDSLASLAFNTLLEYQPGALVSYKFSEVEGNTLMAGEEVEMLETVLPSDGFWLGEKFGAAYEAKKVDLVICYKDVYGTRWQVRRENKIMPVRNCDIK